MNYKEIAKAYKRVRWFFSLKEFYEREGIADQQQQKQILKQVLILVREERTKKDKIIQAIQSDFKAIKITLSDTYYIILHHSTKNKNQFQISTFIKGTATGDSEHEDKKDLLKRTLSDYSYYDKIIIN